MKKMLKFFGIIAFVTVIGFGMTACPEEEEEGEKPPAGTLVPGSTLAEKLSWVLSPANVETGETYVITVDADESIISSTLSYTSRSKITIILWASESGGEKFISPSSNGLLFTVGSGVTLVLDNNITLEGRSNNNNALVYVSSGAMEMRDGAKITGNTTSNYAGGVRVGSNGTFTMNGGEISGNKTTSVYDYGGGVDIFGTFTMNSGVISGNTTSGSGGGVYINNGGTFTMNGGEISGNTASSNGGGVYNNGTFRIVTGTVYGSNESITSMKNTASSGAALYANKTAQRGTFSGTTWTSAGTLTTTNDTIKVEDGELAQ